MLAETGIRGIKSNFSNDILQESVAYNNGIILVETASVNVYPFYVWLNSHA